MLGPEELERYMKNEKCEHPEEEKIITPGSSGSLKINFPLENTDLPEGVVAMTFNEVKEPAPKLTQVYKSPKNQVYETFN